MRVLALFCHVDAFCPTFLPHWEQSVRDDTQRARRRTGHLAMREVMTISIHFHQMRFRDCTTY
jgi:hypothetical protein